MSNIDPEDLGSFKLPDSEKGEASDVWTASGHTALRAPLFNPCHFHGLGWLNSSSAQLRGTIGNTDWEKEQLSRSTDKQKDDR